MTKKYVVVQAPERGSAWRHYFCGYFVNVPHWSASRHEALKVDEASANDLIKRFDDRYRRVVHHQMEEVT